MGEAVVVSRNTSWIVAKWVGFVTAIWVQSIAGNNYTFANYSADLKSVMNYNQLQLNSLGVAKDIGKSVGLLAGFLSGFLPPQVILMIGAAVGCFGYGTTYLVVSEHIAPPAFWQMCFIIFMGGNSTTWMNTAVLVTCMRNFAKNRGTVSGILKGFVGLSTAIFTVLCASLFTGNSSAFLLLLAFLPATICIVAATFLREVPALSAGEEKEEKEERSSFTILNVISILLSFYLLAYTFFGSSLSPSASKLFSIGLLLFLLSPIVVPIKLLGNWVSESGGEKKSSGNLGDETIEPLLKNSSEEVRVQRKEEKKQLVVPVAVTESTATTLHGGAGSSGNVVEYIKPKLGDNFTVTEILSTLDFWVLFLTFLSAIGTGMAVINNMGQIGEALGYPDVAMYVSFFSIFGFFGRIGAGAVSEYFVRSAAIPRPVWMAVSKVFMILGYLALAWGIQGSLPFGSIIVGLCYGVHITIVVATSSEMFGLKSFGMTYNILVLNIPLGSFLFSGFLAGYLYDKEAEKENIPSTNFITKMLNMSSLTDEATKCYGVHCFRTLFIIMSFVLAVGLVLDIFLILKLRPVFQKLYGPKLESKDGETDGRSS